MLDLLRNHFIEVDFDEVFKKALKTVDPRTIDFTDFPVIQSAYDVFHQADNSFTLDEVRQTIAQTIHTENVPAQIEELKTKGLTPVLAALEQHLANAAQSFPIAYDPRTSRVHLQRVSTTCQTVNFYAAWVGLGGGLVGSLAGAGAFEVIGVAAGPIGWGLLGVAAGVMIACS